MLRAISAKVLLVAVIATLAGITTAVATGKAPTKAETDALPELPTGMFQMGVGGVPTTTLEHGDAGREKAGQARAKADGTGNERATGPDADGNAANGLCQAALARLEAGQGSKSERSIAYRSLAEAAAEQGRSISDLCRDLVRLGGDDRRHDPDRDDLRTRTPWNRSGDDDERSR